MVHVYGAISSLNVVTAIASNYQNKRNTGQNSKNAKKKFAEILEEKTDSEQPAVVQHSSIDLKS